MTETVTPQAGDVWESAYGERRFLWKRYSLFATATEGGSIDAGSPEGQRWFAGAKRVFPPVPAPQGETITVECAVMLDDKGDNVGVHGWSDATPKEMARSDDYRMVATVPVVIPLSLLSVPVLPAVTVTP